MEKFVSFFIPNFIWKKIEANLELKKIMTNINWLFFDKAVQMAVAFFVGVWVIRYLGPEKYGILSYAVAFVALFGFVAKLGLDGIAVREFVKKPERRDELLGTLFFLKIIAGILAFALSLLTILFVRPGDTLVFWLTFIIALSFVFQISDVIDFWFQSRVKSRNVVYVRSGINIGSGLVKIILILSKASLLTFAWVILFESVITLFGFAAVFLRNKENVSAIKINLAIGKEILSDSWPLILSGAAVTMYMKIDQIMIGNILNDRLLGNYSVAVSLSEILYFFPAIIVSSVFPAVLYAKKNSEVLYKRRLQLLYDFMMWSSIIFAIPITLFSGNIINFLYGQQYSQAAPVLAVYVWAGVAVSLGVASERFLLADNLMKISFLRTAIGGILNVLLNLYFIPKYGIIGSAFATLISYFVATFSVIFFAKSRKVFYMFIQTLNIFRIFKYFNIK